MNLLSLIYLVWSQQDRSEALSWTNWDFWRSLAESEFNGSGCLRHTKIINWNPFDNYLPYQSPTASVMSHTASFQMKIDSMARHIEFECELSNWVIKQKPLQGRKQGKGDENQVKKETVIRDFLAMIQWLSLHCEFGNDLKILLMV